MTSLIPLTQGKVSLVDDDMYEFLTKYTWHAFQNGGNWYAIRNVVRKDGKRTVEYMHHAVMGTVGIDHKDGDGLNNTRNNLRLATKQQNSWNRKLQPSNTSGFKGVSWDSEKRRWRSRIAVSGKIRHLGYFDSVIRAACAYDEAAFQLYGSFARVNFPRLEG